MAKVRDQARPGPPKKASDALLEGLGKGKPLRADASRALASLLNVSVGRDGLSRFFQPGFPGVRTFVVEARADPDQTLEFTVVGIARSGAPVWVGTRILSRGREGGLEIHHPAEEVDPAYRSRNFIVDAIRRELALIEAINSGPSARITVDAQDVARYLCALHGFVYADETDEGPSSRSTRARDPSSDQRRMAEAAIPFVQRLAQRHHLDTAAVARATRALAGAPQPWALVRADVPGIPNDVPEADIELARPLGRAFLLSEEAPSWRGALYLGGHDEEARRTGDEYRRRHTEIAEKRLAGEIAAARDQLTSSQRGTRIRGLETLALLGAPWVASDVRALTEDVDRRVATAARHTLRAMTGADLPEQILAYAEDNAHPPRFRGLAYRVLAEHFPAHLMPRVSMLRVYPDARVQRAVIPLLAEHPTEGGPELATMLAANPLNETQNRRPGLLDLRVELIERLALRPDPRTLLPLIAALATQPGPPPIEVLALTRALVAYQDPRARVALSAAAQRLDRPAVP